MKISSQSAGKSTGHLASLDVIRGVAILMVFFYHAMFWSHGTNKLPWDGWHRDLDQSLDLLLLIPVTWGHTGVAIFFVVSGFCIHLSHTRCAEKGSIEKHREASRSIEKQFHRKEGGLWLQFVIRRLWRILPPYLIALFIFILGDILTGQLTNRSSVFEQIWTHLLLVHNFKETTHFGVNPSFWSIAVEAQLYWIYPLLWYLNKTIGWRGAMGTSLVVEFSIRLCMAFEVFPHGDLFRPITNGPLAYWFSWSMGAWIAHDWMQGKSNIFSRIPFSLTAFGFVCCWFIAPLEHFFFPMASLATAALLARIVENQGSSASRPQSIVSKSFAFVGSISYSFYLFHQPLISIWNQVILKVIDNLHPLVLFLMLSLSAVPILFLSWLSYRWIECSGIASGKRLIDRIQLQTLPDSAISKHR